MLDNACDEGADITAIYDDDLRWHLTRMCVKNGCDKDFPFHVRRLDRAYEIISNKREASNAAVLAEDHRLFSTTIRFTLIREYTLAKQRLRSCFSLKVINE